MGGAEGPVGLALGGYRPPLRCTPFWEWLRSPTAFPASLHSLSGVASLKTEMESAKKESVVVELGGLFFDSLEPYPSIFR